jgi:FMN-dependent NADH-azoreductase
MPCATSSKRDTASHQRAILSAWYDGYRAANPEQQIISQERFLEESLPEVVEAVAA